VALAFVGLYCIVFRTKARRAPIGQCTQCALRMALVRTSELGNGVQVNAAVGAVTCGRPGMGRHSAPVPGFLPRLATRVTWPFARNRVGLLFIAGVGIALYLGSGAW